MQKTKWNFSSLDKFIKEEDKKNYDEQLLKKQKLFFYESINSYYQIIQACKNLIKEKNNTNISSKDFYFDYYDKFYHSKDFLQSYAEALFDEPTEFKMYSKKVKKYYSSIEDEEMFSGTSYWCTYFEIIADKTFKLKEERYSLNEIRALILDKKIIVKNAIQTNRYADEKSYNDYEKMNENKTEDFIFDNYIHHISENFNDSSVFKNYYTDVFNIIRNNLSLKQIKQDAISYKNQFHEKIEEVISYFDKKSKNIEKELAKFKFYIKTSEKTLTKIKETDNITTIEEVEIVL